MQKKSSIHIVFTLFILHIHPLSDPFYFRATSLKVRSSVAMTGGEALPCGDTFKTFIQAAAAVGFLLDGGHFSSPFSSSINLEPQ